VETFGQDELAGASCGNPPVSAQSLKQEFDQVRRRRFDHNAAADNYRRRLGIRPPRSIEAAPSTAKENRFPIHKDHDVPGSVARQD
jgi:hypothetical protein